MSLGLILNTRPVPYEERFHNAFGDLPWAIFNCPLTKLALTGATTPPPKSFDSVIFTSQMGVRVFPVDQRWTMKRAYVVGAATAEAARAAGFHDVVQTGENVEDLRRHLAATSFGFALYPSAEDVTTDLTAEFPQITRVSIYKMVARESLPPQLVASVREKTPVVVPLFSHRNAGILAVLLQKAGVDAANSSIVAVGLSDEVFTGVAGPWQRQGIADKPTIEALVAKTGEAIASLGP